MANAISDLFFVHLYPFLIFKIYLFLVALGLHCCTWAFSSRSEQGLLSILSVWVSHCGGFSRAVHGLSCSTTGWIFPDQGSNPCALHCQAGSYPLYHQGSPLSLFFKKRLVLSSYDFYLPWNWCDNSSGKNRIVLGIPRAVFLFW